MTTTDRRTDRVRSALATVLAHDALAVEASPIVEVATAQVKGMDSTIGFPHGPPELHVGDRSTRSILRAAGDDEVAPLSVRLIDAIVPLADRARAATSPEAAPTVSVAVDERFVADPSFLDVVKTAVRRSGIEPSQLVLSVEVGPAFADVWSSLQRLKSHGVRIALDGFAAQGPAAEAAGRYRFEFARIQVDGSGPAAAGQRWDAADRAVKLAHRLDCRVLAVTDGRPPSSAALIELGVDLLVGPDAGASVVGSGAGRGYGNARRP